MNNQMEPVMTGVNGKVKNMPNNIHKRTRFIKIFKVGLYFGYC